MENKQQILKLRYVWWKISYLMYQLIFLSRYSLLVCTINGHLAVCIDTRITRNRQTNTNPNFSSADDLYSIALNSALVCFIRVIRVSIHAPKLSFNYDTVLNIITHKM